MLKNRLAKRKAVFLALLSSVLTINTFLPSLAVMADNIQTSTYIPSGYSGVQRFPVSGNAGQYVIPKGVTFDFGNNSESSDSKILKVSKKGMKAVKVGSASITGRYGTMNIEVISPKISKKNVSMQVGDKTELYLNGVSDKTPVSWISSDQNIVQVLSGNCYGVGIGKAKVSAVFGGKSYTCNVRVKDKENSTHVYNVTKGKKTKIKGIEEVEDLQFSTSNNEIKIVDGKIIANSPLKDPVDINIPDGHTLRVYSNDITPVSNAFSIKTGERISIMPENCHEFINFKSNNPNVAVVSEYGVLIGQSEGKTSVTGKINGEKVVIGVTVASERCENKFSNEIKKSIHVIDDINGNEGISVDISKNGDIFIIKDKDRLSTEPSTTPDPTDPGTDDPGPNNPDEPAPAPDIPDNPNDPDEPAPAPVTPDDPDDSDDPAPAPVTPDDPDDSDDPTPVPVTPDDPDDSDDPTPAPVTPDDPGDSDDPTPAPVTPDDPDDSDDPTPAPVTPDDPGDSDDPGVIGYDAPGLYDTSTLTLKKPWKQLKEERIITVANGVLKGPGSSNTDALSGKLIVDKEVKVIGEEAFVFCDKLSLISLPNTVTTIKKKAFHNSGLILINIPDSVTTIEELAFSSTPKLMSVTLPKHITVINKDVFSMATSLQSIDIPEGVTKIDEYSFYWCFSLSQVKLPSTLKTIGTKAFSENAHLSAITVPSSVTSIGNSAFYLVPHVFYRGSASGSPWGAKQLN